MMEINSWFRNPLFYGISGILSMILVIWIARTNMFYLCYLPLLLAAKLVSGSSNPGRGILLPPKMIRLSVYVVGMIVGELLFSFILVAQNELSFQIKSTQAAWNILAIELILGVAVFIFFFLMSIAAGYFFRKITQH